jgi:hypothetical protein
MLRTLLPVTCLLLLTVISGRALAWLRPTYEDATIVERTELLVVAHLKRDSIQKVPHDRKPGEGASWEHHATLVITDVLKGKCDKREIPVILHYGLTPLVREVKNDPTRQAVAIDDTGGNKGRRLVNDACVDNLWFLRRRGGIYGREPGTGNYGVVDPEDVQPLALKRYFLCYLATDPAAAVKEYVRKNPDTAERAKRYFDHLEIQAILALKDPAQRYERLLPFFLRHVTWNMKSEAREGIVACGPVASERLKELFRNPTYHRFRQQVIQLWRDMGYRPAAPLLVDLLRQHDQFWARQRLKKGWWNDWSDPDLTRRRQDIYGEVYTAVCTLRSFRDPRARDMLEATRKRWTEIGFENTQIVEECEAALRELTAK